jgi:hypothetical protein
LVKLSYYITRRDRFPARQCLSVWQLGRWILFMHRDLGKMLKLHVAKK